MTHKVVRKMMDVLCCHLLYRVKYQNLAIIEKYPRCLICPNHSNIFDPTFLYPKIDHMAIMAKKEIFKNPLLAKIWKHYDVFPVDRTTRDVKSVFHSLEVFKGKESRRLLIFPEGGIPKREEPIGSRVKKGPCFIAAKVEVPIIPVYITRYPKLFSKVEVIFGDPIEIPKEVLQDKERLKEESKKLIETIFELKTKGKNSRGEKEKCILV